MTSTFLIMIPSLMKCQQSVQCHSHLGIPDRKPVLYWSPPCYYSRKKDTPLV